MSKYLFLQTIEAYLEPSEPGMGINVKPYKTPKRIINFRYGFIWKFFTAKKKDTTGHKQKEPKGYIRRFLLTCWFCLLLNSLS
jgi:hypothetical protein